MPEDIPQARLEGLPELDPHVLHARRQNVLLIFAGIFFGAMAMLNILGITKFIPIGKGTLEVFGETVPFALAVGVLPYPITFLCTDFISEFYGRRCANWVVFVGLLVNLLVLGFVSLGAWLPSTDPVPFQQVLVLQLESVELASSSGETTNVDPGLGPDPKPDSVLIPLTGSDGKPLRDPEFGARMFSLSEQRRVFLREEGLFDRIAVTTQLAVTASMIAYLAAQFIDVYLFHFWKRLTRGKHLWLRNNGSTLVSQLVDTTAVILVTFWGNTTSYIVALIVAGYLFKLAVALADTIPFYLGVRYLGRYLRIDSVR